MCVYQLCRNALMHLQMEDQETVLGTSQFSSLLLRSGFEIQSNRILPYTFLGNGLSSNGIAKSTMRNR